MSNVDVPLGRCAEMGLPARVRELLDTENIPSATVAVISKQPAGLGIIHLTLQILANALPGARTLFIQNTNLDEAAATGALEIN
jgi:hypothetical protein